MAKKEKTFNYKLYALVAFLLVAAILACTTVFAVKQKYIAFDSEKLAVSYADTIVQKGDGYNAYTYTLPPRATNTAILFAKIICIPSSIPATARIWTVKSLRSLKKRP